MRNTRHMHIVGDIKIDKILKYYTYFPIPITILKPTTPKRFQYTGN